MADVQRLADLLIEPLESPECEIKNWLDLKDSNHDKATFAKAVIALANHGGGFIIIGMAKSGSGLAQAPDRPADLSRYDQDALNGIIQSYCDPTMHCAVHIVAGPDGGAYPIVVVPGGHRVPVRARRGGPSGNVMAVNDIFMRKPGPKSEAPISSQDWDELLGRCIQNRRDELIDRMRDLLSGLVPSSSAPLPPTEPFEAPAPALAAPSMATTPIPLAPDSLALWIDASRARWEELSEKLPPSSGPRMPHGRFTAAYQVLGKRKAITLAKLPEVLRASVVRHSGWPPFWMPSRPGIAPYAMGDCVECWIGGDPTTPPSERDAAHADFWRVSVDGLAYLLRGFQEDGMDGKPARGHAPKSVLDLTIPVWRAGECLLQAQKLAQNLFDEPSSVSFTLRYEGLAGRELVSLNGRRVIFEGHIAKQDTITLHTEVDTAVIGSSLPEIIHPLLSPLYALFDFFDLPKSLVDAELQKLRNGQF